MTQIIRAEEEIKCPLQRSKLNIKGLGDWVVNPTKGCPYGCRFCYVSSTPIIRTSKKQFNQLGILDPLMEWGNYQIIRQDIPQKLEEKLARMRTWHSSSAGQGVVLFSSECDPCPDRRVTEITMKSIEILRKYGKRVRLLTRSTLWTNHLELLQDPGIIRNRSKVNAAVTNAQAYLKLKDEGLTFDQFLWQFTDGKTLQNNWTGLKQLPASTPESDAMSKALKQRGFKFVGSTICYAFMQAIGMVNDHVVTCFRHEECRKLARSTV